MSNESGRRLGMYYLAPLCLVGLVVLNYYGVFSGLANMLSRSPLLFVIGEMEISLWLFLKSLVLLVVFVWSAQVVADIFRFLIGRVTGLKSNVRDLLSKIVSVLIYFLLGLLFLDSVGLDLTSVTVLSGALGIGIGFGLQKITSNFVSGIILLGEGALEVGDIIELDNVYGVIRRISPRYTLVEAFDGAEVLFPNEDFITKQVVNWKLSHSRGRVAIEFGVAYGSDLEQARQLALVAAREHSQALQDPEPQCYLEAFGDNSINFSLLFWIQDVDAGRRAPKSEVMMELWRKLSEAGIEIPFPQRDLHIVSDSREHS